MVRYVIHSIPSSMRHNAPAPSSIDIDEGFFVYHAYKNMASDTLGIDLISDAPGPFGEVLGARVSGLAPASPLKGAISIGDVVVSINGQPALGAVNASEMLRNASGKVPILVLRSKASLVRHCRMKCSSAAFWGNGEKLGIEVTGDVDAGNFTSALRVKHLTASSPLQSCGVRVGDSLLAVNGVPVADPVKAAQLLTDGAARAADVRARPPPSPHLFPSVPLAPSLRTFSSRLSTRELTASRVRGRCVVRAADCVGGRRGQAARRHTRAAAAREHP